MERARTDRASVVINQYGPGEVVDDAGSGTGVWGYFGYNNDFTWPIGYCANGCAGHPNSEEAVKHFKQWLIHNAEWNGKGLRKTCEHEGCGEITESFVSIPFFGWYFWLCDLHRKSVNLPKLFGDLRGIVR